MTYKIAMICVLGGIKRCNRCSDIVQTIENPHRIFQYLFLCFPISMKLKIRLWKFMFIFSSGKINASEYIEHLTVNGSDIFVWKIIETIIQEMIKSECKCDHKVLTPCFAILQLNLTIMVQLVDIDKTDICYIIGEILIEIP